jgi:hypothetical protein
MKAYLIGLATLPVLAVVGLLVRELLAPPSWFEKYCSYCDPGTTWFRNEHPYRPWWVWSVIITTHDLRCGHMPQIREWRREHCERTWFGGWKVVR